jgi:Fe-S cluster biogenesis protein NfuA
MLERIETAASQPELPSLDVGPDVADLRFRAVSAIIDELRPTLQRDGGDCALLAVEGNQVHVRMKGACSGCQLASLTLRGLEAKLTERMGRIMRIVPVA